MATRARKVLAGVAATLAITAAGQAVAYTQAPEVTTAHASWDFHPGSTTELRARARSIVLAEVVSVERGEDLVSEQPPEPGGVSRIPTQRISVRVLDSYKGSARAGHTLTLFQTGGAVLPPPPAEGATATTDVQQLVLEGDPPYELGEQYLLMLEPGPQDTLRPVSPEGRYRHGRETGTLTAVAAHGGVANEIASQRLAALEPFLRGQR